jgi:predicted secreted acid phosphatase
MLRNIHKVIALAVAAFSMAQQMAFACPCQEVKPIPAASINKADYCVETGLKFLNSDEYKKEFASAIDSARKVCEEHKGEPNVCVVSDIDETLLDNSRSYKEHPEYTWPQRHDWLLQGNAPTLQQTADFLFWARKNGYAIFLITGRHESERLATTENLVRDDVSYDALYMRGNDDKRLAEDMKAEYRQAIEKMGFKVIVNIGDQVSDLAGGSAVDCEKLPNKLYFVP